MSAWLLAMALVYAYVAVQFFREGRMGMGVAFIAYTLSNLGLILDILENQK